MAHGCEYCSLKPDKADRAYSAQNPRLGLNWVRSKLVFTSRSPNLASQIFWIKCVNRAVFVPLISRDSVIIGGPFAVLLFFLPETLPMIVIAQSRRKADPEAGVVVRSGTSVVKEMCVSRLA